MPSEAWGPGFPELPQPQVANTAGREPEQQTPLWKAVLRTVGESVFKEEKGMGHFEVTLFKQLLEARDDGRVPCAVIDVQEGNVVYATRGLKEMLGRERSKRLSSSELGLLSDILMVDDQTLNRLLNSERWDRFESHRGRLKWQKDAEKSWTELILGQSADGNLCWQLLLAFHKDVPEFGSLVIVLPKTLETPVPLKLPSMAESIKVHMQEAGSGDVFKAMLTKMRDEAEEEIAKGKQKNFQFVMDAVDMCCKSFSEILMKCGEGDHIVPRVGLSSVKAFEQLEGWEAVCGNMEKELLTAWEANDEVFRETRNKGAKSIACAVSDPTGLDCPLVYISPGFEDLTQYERTFALGRNCRFLQPNERSKNIDFNGPEVRRMKEFCVTQKSGQIINLLLNEAKDGTHFWNLLFMNHIKVKLVGQAKKHYIFGVQTNIVIQKDLLDTFILDSWERGSGKENFKMLRQAFQKEELNYVPKETSLKKLADGIISEWAWTIGKEHSNFWEGANYVPVIGRPAVQEFVGQWPQLMEEAARGIRALFEMTDGNFMGMKHNEDETVVCAVADPAFFDCPLVFLSKGFESMTGYHNEFGLGRNCRFLQPNVGDLNKKINGDELQRMREFCRQPNPLGTKIVNLLLNERKTGERFWNLLHMEHVQVSEKPYILGVQTILEMPMPSLLKDRETSQSVWSYDPSMLTTFVDELAVFLDQMRRMLRGQSIDSMLEAAKYATESIMSFMKRNCDDFEGDHLCPRMGRDDVRHFELDVTWKAVLHKVTNLLVDIWDVSEFNDEEVACAVSDPRGDDCPLVYVSRKFEAMTGYPRHWVLGRNCRFLQPNDSKRNWNFNEEDKLRMREFCSEPQPEGTRIINLLINESRSGYPFWNLLVMEHVYVAGQNLIFGVQTKLDVETSRLTEILAQDRDGISELSRLRSLLRAEEGKLEKIGMKTLADKVIRHWVLDFPLHFEMPRFKLACRGPPMHLPLAGLVLHPQQPLAELLQVALEAGVRHFALALNSEEFIEDPSYVEQVGRLLSFRLAEILNKMRLKYLHYMRQATFFTLITRPQYIESFKCVSKALSASGYGVSCWFLDVRAINVDRQLSKGAQDKLKQCWHTMAEARKAHDCNTIGLYGPMGSIMTAMTCLKDTLKESACGVMALDDYPGKEQHQSRLEKFRKSYCDEYGSPSLLTYNLYGPHQSLLKSQFLKERAEALNIDVCTLLLKWAETQGYGSLVTKVKDDDFDIAEAADLLPEYHRGFTRCYTSAPGAQVCAAQLHDALDDVMTIQKAEYQDHGRRRSNRTSTASNLDGTLSALGSVVPYRSSVRGSTIINTLISMDSDSSPRRQSGSRSSTRHSPLVSGDPDSLRRSSDSRNSVRASVRMSIAAQTAASLQRRRSDEGAQSGKESPNRRRCSSIAQAAHSRGFHSPAAELEEIERSDRRHSTGKKNNRQSLLEVQRESARTDSRLENRASILGNTLMTTQQEDRRSSKEKSPTSQEDRRSSKEKSQTPSPMPPGYTSEQSQQSEHRHSSKEKASATLHDMVPSIVKLENSEPEEPRRSVAVSPVPPDHKPYNLIRAPRASKPEVKPRGDENVSNFIGALRCHGSVLQAGKSSLDLLGDSDPEAAIKEYDLARKLSKEKAAHESEIAEAKAKEKAPTQHTPQVAEKRKSSKEGNMPSKERSFIQVCPPKDPPPKEPLPSVGAQDQKLGGVRAHCASHRRRYSTYSDDLSESDEERQVVAPVQCEAPNESALPMPSLFLSAEEKVARLEQELMKAKMELQQAVARGTSEKEKATPEKLQKTGSRNDSSRRTSKEKGGKSPSKNPSSGMSPQPPAAAPEHAPKSVRERHFIRHATYTSEHSSGDGQSAELESDFKENIQYERQVFVKPAGKNPHSPSAKEDGIESWSTTGSFPEQNWPEQSWSTHSSLPDMSNVCGALGGM